MSDNTIALAILLGFFLLAGGMVMAIVCYLENNPRCPYCNEMLHEVKVRPTDDSMPPDAKWYCSNHSRTHYFADLSARAGCKQEVREL